MAKVTRAKGPYLPTKNNRLISVGQRNLEALQKNNRQNVVNAIAATGYPVTIYNTLRTGIRCTCQYVNQPHTKILDSDGKLSEQHMNTLLTPPSGLLDYGSTSQPLGYNQTQPSISRFELVDSGPMGGNLPPQDVETVLDQWSEEGIISSMNEELTPERLVHSQGQACAICFGTGYIGGYELLHGTRMVLTTKHAHEKDSGLVIDTEASPNTWVATAKGSIRFQIVVPKGTCFALWPRLFNNTKPVPDKLWKLLDNDGRELNPDVFLTLATGRPSYIELKVPDGITFTHLELIFSGRPLDQPAKADCPELQNITDVTRMDAKTPVTFILGGTYNISKRSVIIDHVPRISRHWRVGSIQERRDNLGGYIYEQTLSSRLVDLYEITQLLRPLRYERAPLD